MTSLSSESEKEFEEKPYPEISPEVTYFHEDSYPEFDSPGKENNGYHSKFKSQEINGDNNLAKDNNGNDNNQTQNEGEAAENSRNEENRQILSDIPN